ncbi:MAG: AsmA family protein, partial [Elusimicrobiaceae bacterium]|nr:AsmA family protein [Elusimicrobiaceae bacterium]
MKKWLKRASKALLILVLLLALLDVGLHLLARTQWFTVRVENALKNALGREVDLGNIDANLRGVFVRDIRIAQQGGFEKGTFVKAERLRVQFSLIHLLHAHAQVNLIVLSNATLQIATYKDGSHSWDDFITPANPQLQEDTRDNAFPFNLTAQHVRFEQLHLLYTDKQTPRHLDITGLTLNIKNFSLDHAFPITLIAEFYHKENTFERRIPLTLKATVNLAQLNLPNASAQIQALKAFYKNSSITLTGTLENFKSPQADLKLTLRNVSSTFFKDVTNLPAFDLPQADITVKLASDLEKQTFTLHHLGLQAPGVALKAKGGVAFKDALQYEGTAYTHIILGETGRWLKALADPYQTVGTVEGNLSATNETIAAILTLSEAGAGLPHAGRLANVNGQIDLQGNLKTKTGKTQAKLQGKLNANPFTVDLQATQTTQKIKAVLNVQADEFILPALPQDSTQAQPTSTTSTRTAWPFPPIELDSNI